MKKILLLCLLVLFCGCEKIAPIEPDPIVEFLGTRANAPLENTVWGHETGEKYNMYLLFQDGLASLFYGLYDGKIQRWSPFYSAPYSYANGKLNTRIIYPYYDTEIEAGIFTIIPTASEYEIDVDGDLYRFITTDTAGLEWENMTINVTIAPWINENN